MSGVKWIKITTNMFDDEKIDFIESLPEADSILIIWIKLSPSTKDLRINQLSRNNGLAPLFKGKTLDNYDKPN